MTITPGTRIGPYEVLSPIGAGGKGFRLRPRLHSYALHPDGERFALAPQPTATTVKVDKVVMVLRSAIALPAYTAI